MKKTLLASLALFTAAYGIQAAEQPIELSFFHPIQLHDETTDIMGARLNLFYAVNNNVTGIDIGFLGLGQTEGDQKGISWNFIGNVVKGDMVGWQSGLFTQTMGEFTGLKTGLINLQGGELLGVQYGLVNIAGSKVTGLQVGFFNRANDVHGLQLGFVNMADNLNGLQIGLANFNLSGDPLYFFPFVNFSF